MACIVLETPAGTRYTWPENKARTPIPGEKVVGVDWACGGNLTEADEYEAILSKEGIKIGTAIAYATKKMGFTKCSRCTAREVILNEAKEKGWLETIKRLKETFV